MKFIKMKLNNAFIIDLEQQRDHRGFSAQTFCAREFAAHGLKPVVAQCNLTFNYKKGTLRGMHYQVAPARVAKLVRCTQGAIYDVVIDMRPDSPTFLKHIDVELTAENRWALYVPAMCAHGYQTLVDNTEVVSQVSGFYSPHYERGLRYDDPTFSITWPLPVSEISQKDLAWCLFQSFLLEVDPRSL
ncbi:dTDP-4-dehydrorhamnose 3,5-epimerase family protein [Chroococcidiopsis sp. TS-821]|uniref:dTDP-4-dehydrorhamnose 3,5-epimerase family protein n=1 Tax=Chroococcidiopsis sp. TS-821 TaxID=1378066 RepID=UPI000CEE12F5|nr:dTDP-4-dehydrorhamnose 3,5-epimerase family protein [Chroococcidiopsis sp. TS-821]PPS43338.1 dTDP-4-dehydrorhamnose 3,5-epimerase [Chroococcidiopsis sp. TS-821]